MFTAYSAEEVRELHVCFYKQREIYCIPEFRSNTEICLISGTRYPFILCSSTLMMSLAFSVKFLLSDLCGIFLPSFLSSQEAQKLFFSNAILSLLFHIVMSYGCCVTPGTLDLHRHTKIDQKTPRRLQ